MGKDFNPFFIRKLSVLKVYNAEESYIMIYFIFLICSYTTQKPEA